MAAPKILILTADAAESLEVMYPYQRLREEGYDVQIAALVDRAFLPRAKQKGSRDISPRIQSAFSLTAAGRALKFPDLPEGF